LVGRSHWLVASVENVLVTVNVTADENLPVGRSGSLARVDADVQRKV
jgi:hypothetical protein